MNKQQWFFYMLILFSCPVIFADIDPSTDSIQYLRYSSDGKYVFPLAVDPAHLSWTRYHWDGGNAVDIEVAPRFSADSPEYRSITRAPVLAVTGGTAIPLDNLRGGYSVVLQGDDGLQYYYAHLREQQFSSPVRVERGDIIGRVGSTGQWAQFLEPHLHFSIAEGHHSGYVWDTNIHAAGFLAEHFDLYWQHRDEARYLPDDPYGWPFPEPGVLLEDFAETGRIYRDQAALVLLPPEPLPVLGDDGKSMEKVPVVSPMDGMMSYSRDTVFGPRIQIVNEHRGHLLVFFGIHSDVARDGLTVHKGQMIGYVSPDSPLRLQYFRYGRLSDYQPLLDSRRNLLE
ncbi:M23 family metallopeptidase [Spirochaeta dissipatitropha]